MVYKRTIESAEIEDVSLDVGEYVYVTQPDGKGGNSLIMMDHTMAQELGAALLVASKIEGWKQ